MVGSIQPGSCFSIGCAGGGRVDGNVDLLHNDKERIAIEGREATSRTTAGMQKPSPADGVVSFGERSGVACVEVALAYQTDRSVSWSWRP